MAGYEIVAAGEFDRLQKQQYISFMSENRNRLFRHYAIDLLLDVGANVGQYAIDMRKSGYGGRIVSFEPLTAAFKQLEAVAKGDDRWQLRNAAVGAECGTSTINIAGNSCSSSLLQMLPRHVNAAPESAYTGSESVTVETIDSVFDGLKGSASHIFLKIDTQGFEYQVLQGARESLRNIIGIQAEGSLVPLYQGEMLFEPLVAHMSRVGYKLKFMEPGFCDPATGEMLQVDGLFFRQS